jgi:hypothetical protein
VYGARTSCPVPLVRTARRRLARAARTYSTEAPGRTCQHSKATHSAHVSRRVLSLAGARSGGSVQGGSGPGSGGWRASPGSGVSSLVTDARMAEHTASQSRPSRMKACASTSHQPSLEATATAASGWKRGAAPSAWRSRRIAATDVGALEWRQRREK